MPVLFFFVRHFYIYSSDADYIVLRKSFFFKDYGGEYEKLKMGKKSGLIVCIMYYHYYYYYVKGV